MEIFPSRVCCQVGRSIVQRPHDLTSRILPDFFSLACVVQRFRVPAFANGDLLFGADIGAYNQGSGVSGMKICSLGRMI
jgi:hypothetical protein